MWSQTDQTGVDMQPKEWAAPYYILLSILVNIITNQLFLNLFVGVVIESFNEQKNKLVGLSALTKQKQDWVKMQIMGYQAKPIVKITQSSDKSWLRNQTIRLVSHWVFDAFITTCIIGNATVMCVTWYGQSQRVTDVTNKINLAFISVFTIEMFLKLIALRSDYFKTQWNIFDFIVVTVTLSA